MTLEWMAWTPVTAAFFIVIAVILVGMTFWEIVSPAVERRGFLPISTTRGDRLFIGLLGSAYIYIAWLGLSGINLWFALPVVVIFLIIVMIFG